MKGFKVLMGLLGIIGAGSALAGGFVPSQSNYQQFITRYRGDIIDSRLNTVAPAFVYEAAQALRADGANLRNPDIATFLWRSIENVVNYYASLPANAYNRDFKTRIWQSLLRSLDEVARTQQPMIQPVVQPVRQAVQANKDEGIEALRTFRMKTSQIIQTNPTYFYSAGAIQPAWLREALYLLTDRDGISITMQNQAAIREELMGAADELMRQILRNNQRLSPSQKENVIQMIRSQVEQFVNARVMRSRI